MKSIIQNSETVDLTEFPLNHNDGHCVSFWDRQDECFLNEQDSVQIEQIREQCDRYVEMPADRDFDDWALSQDFISTVEDQAVKSELREASHGDGAFSRFQDAATRHGLYGAWGAFQEQHHIDYLNDWCKENGIPVTVAK